LEARRKGVLFFRFIPDEAPVVYDDHGRLVVDFTDRSSHQEFRITPDLVALSSGIRPASDNEKIARMLKLVANSGRLFYGGTCQASSGGISNSRYFFSRPGPQPEVCR
jgi:heterodisulfide reductase subunit A2